MKPFPVFYFCALALSACSSGQESFADACAGAGDSQAIADCQMRLEMDKIDQIQANEKLIRSVDPSIRGALGSRHGGF